MRRCNLANLLYYFHRSAGCLDPQFGFITYRIHFESDLALQFPVSKDLYFIGSAYQSVYIKIFKGKLSDTVLFCELPGLADIEYFVLDPVRVSKPSFGYPALDRHLTAFVRHLPFVTSPALTAFITFCGCATMTGSFTTP